MEMNKPAYYYVSKYRTALMGLAILWVTWFHSRVYIDFFSIGFLKNIFNYIQARGYGGVDIFMFVSGMGIYHSLSKNTTSRFIANRVKRIGPVWWSYLVISSVLLFFIFHRSSSFQELLGYASFTGYWIGLPNQGNWYVYAIVLFYLLSPVFYSIITETKSIKGTAAFMILMAVIISFVFFDSHDYIICFSRLPVYLMGMIFASQSEAGKMSKPKWCICLGLFVLSNIVMYLCAHYLDDSVLWEKGLYWYPFIVIAPTFSILFCGILEKLSKYISWLIVVLNKIGKASLEILLVQDFIFTYVEREGTIKFWIISDIITALSATLLSIIGGLIFSFVIHYVQSLFIGRKFNV